MLFIAPAAVVAVVMLANLIFQQGRNLGVWLGYVGGVVVVCGVILGTVVRRDARLRRDAPPDVLLEGFGRFRLDEWAATAELQGVLGGLDARRVRRLARGWAEGRVWLTERELRFTPGRIAKGDGVPGINIPWSGVEHVGVVPESLSMACGLRLFLDESGTTLDMEVRAHRASIESALERTSLGTA